MYNTVYANQREREESLYERRVMSVKKHYYYHPELPIYLNLTGRHAGREWMIACKLNNRQGHCLCLCSVCSGESCLYILPTRRECVAAVCRIMRRSTCFFSAVENLRLAQKERHFYFEQVHYFVHKDLTSPGKMQKRAKMEM